MGRWVFSSSVLFDRFRYRSLPGQHEYALVSMSAPYDTKSAAALEEERLPETQPEAGIDDGDAEFGGPEERKRLEKKLLRKLDARMSILIVIYILNYIDRNKAS